MQSAVSLPPPPAAAVLTVELRSQLPALYARMRDPLFAYAASVLGDRDAAEDVVADTFERAWSKHRRFSSRRGSAESWIWAIARNRTLDELRRRSRHADPVDPDELVGALAGDAADGVAEQVTVARAMAQLTPGDRELLALRFWADLAHEQIADVLGISRGAVAVRLHRLLRALSDDDTWKETR